ncbi:hypothetical protein [Streptomyces sp. NPDC090029]|uniref:hypothetical protein n=1 Tax=Streptomyces sp. NPDC090029 TaxID=3365924 RepID=UPI00382FF160
MAAVRQAAEDRWAQRGDRGGGPVRGQFDRPRHRAGHLRHPAGAAGQRRRGVLAQPGGVAAEDLLEGGHGGPAVLEPVDPQRASRYLPGRVRRRTAPGGVARARGGA